MNALNLFRRGYDTQEIADRLGLEEYDVYNEIARLKGDLQPVPAPKPKIIPPSKTAEYQREYNSERNKRLRADLARIRQEARV